MIEKLKKKAKDLKRQVMTLYFAIRHKNTPLYAKVAGAVVVAYALSPIDLIPDFIPILGFLDDIILLPAAIFLVIKLIPDDVMDECKKLTEDIDERPKNYFMAVIIAAVWVSLITLIVLKIVN